MKIVKHESLLSPILIEKGEYFEFLESYLSVCKDFIKSRNSELSFDYFPPPAKEVEKMKEKIKVANKKRLNQDPPPIAKLIAQKGLTYRDRESSPFVSIKTSLDEILMKDIESFEKLISVCWWIQNVCLDPFFQARSPKLLNFTMEVEQLGRTVIGKSYELIGFWTAKMERSRSARKSNLPKTQAVHNNEQLIKHLLF